MDPFLKISDFGANQPTIKGGSFEALNLFRVPQNTPCYLPLQIFPH